MLTIRRTHQISIASVSILAAIGVMSGSMMLLVSGLGLCIAILFGTSRLYFRNHTTAQIWLTHLLTLCGLFYAVLVFRTSRIDSVLFVLMLGVFNRIVLRMGRRDDFFVLVSSSILFAAATTVTPGFEFALLIILFVPALLMAMWMTTILGMAEVSPEISAYQAVLSRPRPAGLGKLAMFGLGFTILGFSALSILPRFTFLPMLGAGAFARFGGVSNSMTLGTDGVSGEGGTEVVIRVETLGTESRDELPGLYARMYALDEFDGKNWSSTSRGIFRLAKPQVESEKPIQPLKVTVKRTGSPGAIAMPQIGRQFGTHVFGRRVFENLNGSWTTGLVKGLEYDFMIDLAVPTATAAIPKGHLEAQDRRLLHLPGSLDPRILRLAQDLTKDSESPTEKIRAVLAHFDRGFEYSLEPLEGDDVDPLARFLFEAKKGHCELYAGALAVLLRAVGVKTRIASGYYGGRFNEMGGYLGFTGTDAHAWVEAWIPNKGWRWIDGTPEERRWRRSQTGLFTQLSDFYDALNRIWYDNVVDYESKNDVLSIAMMLLRGSRSSGLGTEQEGGLLDTPERKTNWLAYIISIVTSFGLVVLGILVFRKRRRSLEAIGRRLRDALGDEPGKHVSLEDLLEAFHLPGFELAVTLVREYQKLRFGPEIPKAEYRQRCAYLDSEIHSLKQILESK